MAMQLGSQENQPADQFVGCVPEEDAVKAYYSSRAPVLANWH
jgi:hypothetical protein